MKKHSLKLALLCSTVLAAATLATPAQAVTDPAVENDYHCILALWEPSSATLIEITDGGVTGPIFCHNSNLDLQTEDGVTQIKDCEQEETSVIDAEAFTVCVSNKFHVGADGDGKLVNLNPSVNPSTPTSEPGLPPTSGTLHRPFVVRGSKVVFLKVDFDSPKFRCCDGTIVPLYNLDDPNGDGNTADALKLGEMVNVITENLPVKNALADDGMTKVTKCIGVRTTFQHRVGTCKIWKVRKYFNTCGSAQTITQVKEFEQISGTATAGGQAGPGGSLRAVAQHDDFHS